MKFIFWLGILTFIHFSAVSQIHSLNFTVQDSVNYNSIAFANVGVLGKPIGTNSNELGQVNFLVKSAEVETGDTFIISCIGYESKELKWSEFRQLQNGVLYLKPKTYILDNVIVSSQKTKRKILGKDEKGAFTHINIYGVRDSIDDGLSQEFGTMVNINQSYCLVNNFNVFFSSNNFKQLKMRLNFYRLDEDNVPDSIVNHSDVIFDVDNSFIGWKTVDLSTNNIALSKGKYGVCAQLLKTKLNANIRPALAIPVATPSPFNGFLYRGKSQNEWSINNSANPSIYLEADCSK